MKSLDIEKQRKKVQLYKLIARRMRRRQVFARRVLQKGCQKQIDFCY